MTDDRYCDVHPLREGHRLHCSEWRCLKRAGYHVTIKLRFRTREWDFCEDHMLSAVEHFKTKLPDTV